MATSTVSLTERPAWQALGAHCRAREFEEALNWRQHWQALLPLSAQGRLLIARLRGRFTYGTHRRLAYWSLLRFAPLVAVLTLAASSGVWIDAMRQEQQAADLLNQIGTGTGMVDEEAAAWRPTVWRPCWRASTTGTTTTASPGCWRTAPTRIS